jgi:hypothetical protein
VGDGQLTTGSLDHHLVLAVRRRSSPHPANLPPGPVGELVVAVLVGGVSHKARISPGNRQTPN